MYDSKSLKKNSALYPFFLFIGPESCYRKKKNIYEGNLKGCLQPHTKIAY
jgi:hypothetical protein